MLKADFHLHTDADPKDKIAYGNREIIDLAAAKGYHCLAITNHRVVTFDGELRDYAADKGILLLPGVELTVEGKHVILINARPEHLRIRTFADLAAARCEELLVIAPHPFFPQQRCLNGSFLRHRQLFDALEFCHFYHPLVNFNRRVERLHRDEGIPLVGSSDTHLLRQFSTTWTLVDAAPDPLEVVRAVRAGLTRVVTRPLGLLEFVILGLQMIWVT